MEIEEKNKYWVWLSLIKGLGNRRVIKLLDKYQDPEKIYNLNSKQLLQEPGIGRNIMEAMLDKKTRGDILRKQIEEMKKRQIQIITLQDKKYPQNLKQIYDPPILLFTKGDNRILNGNNLAIVGSRQCSEYGKKMTQYFSYHLAKQGMNIVSGLAKGIDAYAHTACLAAGRKNNCCFRK